MPYIKQSDRLPLDAIVQRVDAEMTRSHPEQVDGQINYLFSKILMAVYENPLSYYNFNRMIGVIENVKQEAYRQRVAPYEDQKIKENGDL